MASSGYDEADVPNAPPIAPGGGNAWHMGGHFACMAIMAALVYRTVSGQASTSDTSIHEACALTTESAVVNYIYRARFCSADRPAPCARSVAPHPVPCQGRHLCLCPRSRSAES